MNANIIHDVTSAFQLTEVSQPEHIMNYLHILESLTLSSIIGALIAYHPKRQYESDGPVSEREMRITQILICVAGTIMVVMIQDSLARAFGLVGLGSFIRYRTALRNPFDLAIIFILIGLGMACGMGLQEPEMYRFAISITAFIYILLYVLAYVGSSYKYRWQLRIDTTNPSMVEKVFREIANQRNYRILRIRKSREAGRFRCSFSSKRYFDTDELAKQVKEACGPNVHFTLFDWEIEKE